MELGEFVGMVSADVFIQAAVDVKYRSSVLNPAVEKLIESYVTGLSVSQEEAMIDYIEDPILFAYLFIVS
jgi:hypothetical protein